MIKQFCISLVFISTFNFIGFSQENWELRKNEGGIKVYTRNKEGSKVVEFKVLAEIDASVSTLMNVLKDVGSYDQWMEDLKSAKKLKTVSEEEWYVYYTSSIPWPFEDRDIIYLAKIIEVKESKILSLSARPDFIPKAKDYVRINKAEGKWVFTPISENKSAVLYQFWADPEIAVPLWLANMFIVDGPFRTVKGLQNRVNYKK